MKHYSDDSDSIRSICNAVRRVHMTKTKYYVFKHLRYGDAFAEEYWTGDITDVGMPARTKKIMGALAFNTAREAYDAAGQHKKLNWWRVGERQPMYGVETIQ